MLLAGVFSIGVSFISFDKLDLILAALFFGISLFFAALSAAWKVLAIISLEGFFFAFFSKSFSASRTALFLVCRFLSCRNFLIADFVTGMDVF